MPDRHISRRLLISQLLAGGAALAQESNSQDRTSQPDLLATLRTAHPRLILPSPELARVRALTLEHPTARKLYESLLREADRLQNAPPVDFRPGPRGLLPQCRRVVDRIYTLALLQRLTGDSAYATRAVKELHAAALLPNWNPAHFVEVAEMSHAFAIGYDWLYNSLSPVERDWIRAALVEKGLDAALAAYREPAPWVKDDNASNLIGNSGAVIAALAVADEERERAHAIFYFAVDSIKRGLATYSPDGGWPEGPTYWHYGTRYVTHLLAALESALDSDLGLSHSHGLERTGRFRVYATGPTNKTFNFGDAVDDAGCAPEMFWLARRFDQPVFAWQERMQVERSSRADPLDLVWFYKDAHRPYGDDWPLNTVFTGIQTAFLRTSWDDPNALYLAVKGGDNEYSHAHPDLGSFVFDAGGVRWSSMPEFDSGTDMHSTVTINGASQYRKAQARIVRREFASDPTWVQIDLTNAYPGKTRSFQRRIGIVQKQALLISDSILSDQPVEPLWGMLTEADIAVNGQTAELRKNDWVLACEIRSPRHAVFDAVLAGPFHKLVVRLGAKITELSLNIILVPHRASLTKPVITKDFPV